MATSIRIQREDGSWETLGQNTARGLRPISVRPTANASGPDKLSFDLLRDPGVVWPDLRALTPVECEIDGQTVWDGRIVDTPMMEGADRKINVNCDGWQYHLDDVSYRRLYAMTDHSQWKDLKDSDAPSANLQWSTEVNQENGDITFGWPTGTPYGLDRYTGVWFDCGPDPDRWIKAMTFYWDPVNVAGNSTFSGFIRSSNTRPQFVGSSLPSDALSGGTFAMSAIANVTNQRWQALWSTPQRYIALFMGIVSGSGTTGADHMMRVRELTLYGESDWYSHGVSMVMADQIVEDALDKAAPMITPDSEVTAPYYDAVKSIPTTRLQGYWRGGRDFERKDASGNGRVPASNTGSGVDWYTSGVTPVPAVAPDPREVDPGGIDFLGGLDGQGLNIASTAPLHTMSASDFWAEAVFKYHGANDPFAVIFSLGHQISPAGGISLYLSGAAANNTVGNRLWVFRNLAASAADNTGIDLIPGQTYYASLSSVTSGANNLYVVYVLRKDDTSGSWTGIYASPVVTLGPFAGSRVSLGAPITGAGWFPAWMTVDEFAFGTGDFNNNVAYYRRAAPKMNPRYIGNFHQTSFPVPELEFNEARSPRDVISGINAFHNYITRVAPGRKMQFKPRPSHPAVVIGEWPGSEFQDASANSAEEVINVAQGEAEDGTGKRLLSIKTSGDVRQSFWDKPSDVNQPRSLSGIFDGASSSDIYWLDATNGTVAGQTWLGELNISSAFASTGTHSGQIQSNASGSFLVGLAHQGWSWSNGSTTGKRWMKGLPYRLYFDLLRPSANAGNGAGATIEVWQNGRVIASKLLRYTDLPGNTWVKGMYIDFIPTKNVMSYPPTPVSAAYEAAHPTLVIRDNGQTANTGILYIDNLQMYRAVTTVADRRGYVKGRVVSVSSAASQAALDQITLAYMENHKSTPLKGSVSIGGRGGARDPFNGRAIPPAHLLLYANENIRLTNRIDPDTGALGRDGVIASVNYDDDAGEATLEIDNTTKNFEAMLERYQLIVGRAAGR